MRHIFSRKTEKFAAPNTTQNTLRTQAERRRGFTLIELLVVISIIAILAAILFPVFARARENARRSSCLSNTKQLGLAVLQYTQDYDEKLPALWAAPFTDPKATYWFQMVEPYVKSTQIYFCPSDSVSSNTQGIGPNNMSYGWNFEFRNADLATNDKGGLSLAAISNVSQTIMLGDGSNPATGSYFIYWSWADAQPRSRHLEGANVCFMDGHSKWSKIPGELTKDGTFWDTN